MSNQATLASFTDLFDFPMDTYNQGFSPSSSSTSFSATTYVNFLLFATLIFILLAYLTLRMGWWTYVHPDDIDFVGIEQTHNDLLLRIDNEISKAISDNNRQVCERNRAKVLQKRHELRELEAYFLRSFALPTPVFWTPLKFAFVFLVIVWKWNDSFSVFAANFAWEDTWRSCGALAVGDWGGVSLACGLLTWILLHLGDVLGREGAREVHVVADRVGWEFVAVVGEVLVMGWEGLCWVWRAVKGMGEMSEVENRERVWSAWEIEERERRRLGLDSGRGGRGIRM